TPNRAPCPGTHPPTERAQGNLFTFVPISRLVPRLDGGKRAAPEMDYPAGVRRARNSIVNIGRQGRLGSLPPLRALAGEGGEGEAACSEPGASPSPALRPKSDLSDFGSILKLPKSGKPDFGRKRGRGRGRCVRLTHPHTVSTILPMCWLDSMRACAAAASASWNVLSITGRTLPVATNGQTRVSIARAIAVLSALARERSVEPVWCRRLSMMRMKLTVA